MPDLTNELLVSVTFDYSISPQSSKTNPGCTISSQNSLSDGQHPSTDQYKYSAHSIILLFLPH